MAVISPIFNDPSFNDNQGNPLSGGLIFTYEAGSSSILKDTFTTPAGDVANSNPIVLDSSGRLPTSIWLSEGEAYNLVLTKSDGTTVLKGFDDVTGATSGDGGGGGTAIWVSATGGTYLSPMQFLVTGNLTSAFGIGNRVRITLSGGYTYGTVTAVSFSSPNTQVTIINDGAVLNSSLSLVEYSVLRASQGETVDAGGVSYFDAFNYAPLTNTVGWKLQAVATGASGSIADVEAKRARDQKVWDTTTVGVDTYTLTPTPAITSYAVDQRFTIRVTNINLGMPTININGVGPATLAMYNAAGVLVAPNFAASQVTDIAYNGASWVVLDPLTPSAAVAPHGMQVFGSNSTFTVPAGVYSIKVTCTGGGGGGGNFIDTGGGDSGGATYGGGGGGGGATASKVITTTPGTGYSVGVGSGGAATVSGGSSSFGITLVIGTGGAAGSSGIPTAAGGAGGNVGSVGTFISPGGTGQNGSQSMLTAAGGGSTQGYYGTGGFADSPGAQGYVLVEW